MVSMDSGNASRLRKIVLLFTACWIVACSASEHSQPNVLLLTMDTTRYDVITPSITPHIQSIREESLWFDACTSPSPITLPAHSSILTGTYPNRHGVRDNTIFRLSEDAVTLPEIFQGRGYHTAAFVSSFILDHRFGLNQGFLRYSDRFLQPRNSTSRLPVERRAEETINMTLSHLRQNLQEPFFLWVHLYDPHADYSPPPPFDSLAPSEPYIGEVAYMDHQIGRLVDFMRETRLWYRTVTVVAADHGESLGSHQEPTHGFLLHEATLHVPLMVHLPHQTKGSVVHRPVSLVDIFPTILQLTGLPPSSCDGADLMKVSDRLIYSETYIPQAFFWSPLFRVRKDNSVYVATPHDAAYDLSNDPGENCPLREIPSELKRAAERYRSRNPERETRVPLDQETIDRLRSLGYFLAGGATTGETVSGPDPWTRMGVFRRYMETMNYIEEGRWKEAESGARAILHEEGDNPRFLLLAADIASRCGKPREALEFARRAVRSVPSDPRNHFMEGVYLEQVGDRERAEDAYRVALSLRPDHSLARYNLSRLYILDGNLEEAELILRSLLRDVPTLAAGWNNLAYLIMEKTGNCEEALPAVRKALSLNPHSVMYEMSYASTLCACGERDRGISMLTALLSQKNTPELKDQLRGEMDRCKN